MKATVQQLSPSINLDSSKKNFNQASPDNFNGSRSSLSQFKKSLQSSMLAPTENQATVRVSLSGTKKSLKVVDNETYDYYLGIYKEDLAQERQKNYMLNEKIKELKEFNDRFNPARIIDLEQEIARLNQENDEFRKGLEEASDLQANLEKINHENSILKNQNKLLHNEINLLNQKLVQLEEYETNCAQLTQDCQTLLSQNDQLSNDHQNISSEYETLKAKLEELLKLNSSMSQQLEVTTKSKKNLENRIALYSGQISALEQRADQVSKVENENLEMKTQIRAFEQELNYLEALAVKHDEIDSELTKAKALIEEYKDGLQEADHQIVKLKKTLAENLDWKEKFFEVEKKLSIVSDSSFELTKVKSAFNISDRANNQLLNENSILMNNNEALKYKIESKDKEIERLLQACSRNEETIDKLIKENEDLTKLLRNAEKSLEEVNKIAQEKEKSNSNLNFQNTEILNENKRLQEELKNLETKNKDYRTSVADLHSNVHDITKELEKMKGSSNEIVKERDYLKSKFNGVEEKLTKVSALEFELEKTKAKLNVSETLRNAAQSNYQEMQEKYKAIKEEANLYEKFQILLTKNQQLGDLLSEQNSLAERLQVELNSSKNENASLLNYKSQCEQELKKTKEDLSFWQEKYMKATKLKV